MIRPSALPFFFGGGFPASSYGTVVAQWDAVNLISSAGLITSVPNSVAGGPALTVPSGRTAPAESTWTGTLAGKAVAFAAGSTNTLGIAAGTISTINNWIIAHVFDQISALNAANQMPISAGSMQFWHGVGGGSNLLQEVNGAGSGGSVAGITGRQSWIIQTTTAVNSLVYRNGSLISTFNSAFIPATNTVYVGNRTVSGIYGAGIRWRTTILYSALSVTPAALDTALRAYYGV